jgi:predicted DsbA family dithiol-disulfide isomerase
MHDLLFAEPDPDPVELAERLGLDVARFADELGSGAHAERVRSDRARGEADGVTGTPAFFVGGERHRGFYDVEALVDALLDAGA